MTIEYTLPALGEGITKGIVVNIAVQVGSTVSFDDTLFEVETEKAVLPVPSPSSGIITKILIKVGDTVKVGQMVAIIDNHDDLHTSQSINNTNNIQQQSDNEKSNENISSLKIETIKEQSLETKVSLSPLNELPPYEANILAGPATRKFAREMGIDLAFVKGSKKNGRIDIEDVKQFVKLNVSSSLSTKVSSQNFEIARLPDFKKFGEITREPLSNLRNTIAKNLTQSWTRIPHVFQFQEVDITELSHTQNRNHAVFKERGSTASITVFIIKALARCLQEFPKFNASYDEASQELIVKKYYHIGVAVDTTAGLIVPVIRNVNQLSIFEIGVKLRELAQKARMRKLSLDELQGSCITLSNLGGIGGTHFTPIINHPEVAIIGVGAEMIQPRYQNGTFVPRSILPICLSYDHRIIDGADAARFIVRFTNILENFEPTLLGA